MILPLKKVVFLSAVMSSVVLGIALLFGIRQYSLQSHYENVIGRSERLIFQFTTIREHITESLLGGERLSLEEIIQEVQALNADISGIMDDILIPDEFKLTFISQMDLAEMALLLRNLASDKANRETVLKLNRETRLLTERLMRFDRIIVNHAKTQLVGFQKVVIGSLAIIVFLVAAILMLLNSRLAIPLLELSRQVREIGAGTRETVRVRRARGDVAELAESYNELVAARRMIEADLESRHRLLKAVAKVNETIARSASREALFNGVCRALLSNEDYCLVWVGLPDPESRDVLPVAADGCTSMDNRQCDECMAVLLTSVEEKGIQYNAAAQARESRKPVVLRDILEDVPMGPFKNTPLAKGYACVAAFPIIEGETLHGIINVYSSRPGCFAEYECEVLEKVAGEVAAAMACVEKSKALDYKNNLICQLVQSLHGVVVSLARTGEIISLNPEAERLTGYLSKDVQGKDWVAVFAPPGWQARHDELIRAFGQNDVTEIDGELEVLCRDGGVRLLRCHFFSAEGHTGDRQGIVLVGDDITEQRALGQLSGNLEAQLKGLLEAVESLIFILTPEGVIINANPFAAESVTGGSTEGIAGRPVWQVLGAGRKRIEELLRDLMAGKDVPPYEDRFEALPGEYRVTMKPIFGSGGAPHSVLLVLRDVQEEKARKAVALKVCRLASIGELAAGVAHEVNNLINGIMNYAQVLIDQAKDAGWRSEDAGLLERIVREGERIADVVGQLLAFARDRGQKSEKVRMEDLVAESLSLIAHQLRNEGIKVTMTFPEDIPPVHVSFQQMQQVFLNLLSNARNALNVRYPGQDENKRLEIRGEVTQRDGGRFLSVSLTDWGGGIEEAVLPHVFEPFFSTRLPEEGIGLGLTISRELVRDHNGELRLASTQGDCTTATVELPLDAG